MKMQDQLIVDSLSQLPSEKSSSRTRNLNVLPSKITIGYIIYLLPNNNSKRRRCLYCCKLHTDKEGYGYTNFEAIEHHCRTEDPELHKADFAIT